MEQTEHLQHWMNKETEVPEIDPEPIWEEQNFDPPIYITLARIYDLLAIIAMKITPEMARETIEDHEHGKLIGMSPYLMVELEDEDGRD